MREQIAKIMRDYDKVIMTPAEWNHFMRKFNLALQEQDWALFYETKQELITTYAN